MFHTATYPGYAVIKTLLTTGIDVTAKDKKGQTALQMAKATLHRQPTALPSGHASLHFGFRRR